MKLVHNHSADWQCEYLNIENMATLNIGTITNFFTRLQRNLSDPESNPLITIPPKLNTKKEQGYIRLLKIGSGKQIFYTNISKQSIPSFNQGFGRTLEMPTLGNPSKSST